MPYFAVWLIGVAAAAWRLTVPVRHALLVLVAFAGFLLAFRIGLRDAFLDAHRGVKNLLDLATGLLFAQLIVALRPRPRAMPLAAPRTWTWLASFSYTLYCVHTPLIQALAATTERLDWPEFCIAPTGLVH